MSDSIFGSLATSRAPTSWTSQRTIETRTIETTPRAVTTKPSPRPPVGEDRDAGPLAILEAPLLPGEPAFAGFARKEAELRAAFAALSVMEARALHARFSHPKANDRLAQLFMRLTADRRARLINFLADARRREALAANRCKT
jgi:hypothetical protein